MSRNSSPGIDVLPAFPGKKGIPTFADPLATYPDPYSFVASHGIEAYQLVEWLLRDVERVQFIEAYASAMAQRSGGASTEDVPEELETVIERIVANGLVPNAKAIRPSDVLALLRSPAALVDTHLRIMASDSPYWRQVTLPPPPPRTSKFLWLAVAASILLSLVAVVSAWFPSRDKPLAGPIRSVPEDFLASVREQRAQNALLTEYVNNRIIPAIESPFPGSKPYIAGETRLYRQDLSRIRRIAQYDFNRLPSTLTFDEAVTALGMNLLSDATSSNASMVNVHAAPILNDSSTAAAKFYLAELAIAKLKRMGVNGAEARGSERVELSVELAEDRQRGRLICREGAGQQAVIAFLTEAIPVPLFSLFTSTEKQGDLVDVSTRERTARIEFSSGDRSYAHIAFTNKANRIDERFGKRSKYAVVNFEALVEYQGAGSPQVSFSSGGSGGIVQTAAPPVTEYGRWQQFSIPVEIGTAQEWPTVLSITLTGLPTASDTEPSEQVIVSVRNAFVRMQPEDTLPASAD